MPEQIVSLILELFAGFGGIALVLFLTWIFFPEKIEKWALLFHRLLAFASEKHERQYIAKHIENNITSWKEKLCEECKGALPYDVRIKWVGVEEIESELEKETLILKMKNHRNQSKNFAFAVGEYVQNTLIPKARRYVEPIVMNGIDFVVSKSILSGDTRAFSYFVDTKQKELETEPKLKPMFEELDFINTQGYLTRILLSEYDGLSKLFPAEPNQEIHKETSDFEKIVFKLVTKKPEEDVSPVLNRRHLQVAIVQVAKSLTLLTQGTQPHLYFIKKSIENGISKFYITATSGMIPYARELCEKAMKECGLSKISEDEYLGIFRQKRTEIYCACLKGT